MKMRKMWKAMTLGTVMVTMLAGAQTASAKETGAKPAETDNESIINATKLFLELPEDLVNVPDSMTIDKDGNLILTVPNFADTSMPGCVLKIDKDKNVTKWFDVPVNEATGRANPMGIAFDDEWNMYLADNQPWTGEELTKNQGRLLKITFDENGELATCTEMATGMEHPNGLRVRDGYVYMTMSSLTPIEAEDGSGHLVSGVYRFPCDAEGIQITNSLEDENLLQTFITDNPDCQYGLDGIEFDKDGNLLVGDFGDGEVEKITFNEDGSVKEVTSYAKDPENLRTTDGMFMDADNTLYIADFSANAIAKVRPDGTVERIAASPDSDGADGELDQPGEPIIWNGKLIVSCFDNVTDDTKVNTAHEAPFTLCELDVYAPKAEVMNKTELFAKLPEDLVNVPDSMAVDKDGNLILTVPNFADTSVPGCVLKIDKDMNITKWFDVPVNEATGRANPMGIAFDDEWNMYLADNQPWTGEELTKNQGRLLKITFDENGELATCTEMATGMEHPNGIRVRDGYVYMTMSSLTPIEAEDGSGHLVSGVYKFPCDAEGIQVTNSLEDENLLQTFITDNSRCQYGLDGIEFDHDGNLLVGDFGDGEVEKITFNEDGTVKEITSYAKDWTQLATTDGMYMDEDGILYVADFQENAVARIFPDGKVERIAASPDADGTNGELDQPGEPIVWNGRLVLSCFDNVADELKVNTGHDMPATMAVMDLPE